MEMSGIGKGHNKYISCAGCPHGCAEPDCHKVCAGYQYSMKKDEDVKMNRRKDKWNTRL